MISVQVVIIRSDVKYDISNNVQLNIDDNARSRLNDMKTNDHNIDNNF